jgi:enoyl-CoA hydratase/carnithine racemase
VSSLPGTGYRNLLVTRDGSAVRIVLNRPEKRNALSPELMEEMIGELGEVSARRDTRAIVIEGAGPAFSAGHDPIGDDRQRTRVLGTSLRPVQRDDADDP